MSSGNEHLSADDYILESSADIDEDIDYSGYWGSTAEWLERLKRLVESDVAFSTLKFADYLEAEVELFHRMPELRAVGQEARRLCRENPRNSTQIKSRMEYLQSTWLAIESQLAEFKSQRNLLAGSSSLQNAGQVSDHDCGIKRIERLDIIVQRKDNQLQQMRSITSAISSLLDWLCQSELLVASPKDRRRVRRSLMERRRVRTGNAAAFARPSPPVTVNQSVTRSECTNGVSTAAYLLTQSVTDGDQGWSVSIDDSNEIIAHTGIDIENQNQKGHHIVSQLQQEGKPLTHYANDCSITLSPLLQTVGERVAQLKSSTYAIQASLDGAEAVPPSEESQQFSQLGAAEAALDDWQRELLGLRSSVLAAIASKSPPQEAMYRRAYLESIKLLSNWMASLRDRCRFRQLVRR